MKRLIVLCALALAVWAVLAERARGADEPPIQPLPSNAEINMLLDEAEQKVTAWEATMRTVRTRLDALPDTEHAGTTVLALATPPRTMIAAIRQGASAYNLVGLVVSLDDMAHATSLANIGLLATGAINAAEAMRLLDTQITVHDIAGLLFHVALRSIETEEKVLDKLLKAPQQKTKFY